MTGRQRAFWVGVVVLVLALVWAPWAGSDAHRDTERAGKVMVVSLPRLTWASVEAHEADLPTLTALVHRSTVAELSVRTIGPRTSLDEAYATIGAGNRATITDPYGGQAFDRSEVVGEEGRAIDVWQRRTGLQTDAAVVHIGTPTLQRANSKLLYGAEVGALGDALHEAGRTTAVIGNADTNVAIERPLALALMGRDGAVDGVVGKVLTDADPTAPFGIATRSAFVVEEVAKAWAAHDVVLVEASDLERAAQYRSVSTPTAAADQELTALRSADELLREILAGVDLTRDVVMVLSPDAPKTGEALTVFAMAGPGIRPGLAVSPTTRRTGYVSLPDIGPTVLDRLGLDAPSEMTGTVITEGHHTAVDAELVHHLVRANERALFRDDVSGTISTLFVIGQILLYIAAALVLRLEQGSLRRPVGFAALVVLAVPTVAFLSGLVGYDRLGTGGYIAAVAAASVVLAQLASWAGRWCAGRFGVERAVVTPTLLVALLWLMLIFDAVVGAPLQIGTVFGYSPIVAGRFAGYGNLAFTLVCTSAVLLVTSVTGLVRRGAPDPVKGWPLVSGPVAWAAVVLGVTVIVDGHPSFGSDVGGVLAAVPAFGLTLLLLSSRRVNAVRVAIVVGVTAAILGIFTAIDLARPPEERTHLGRFVARLGGDGGFARVLERKGRSNLNILTSSIWALVIPFGLLFLLILIRRGSGSLGELQERIPAIRAGLVGALAVGVLGFCVNDSGVAIPAMMFAVLLPYCSYLVLRGGDDPPDAPPVRGAVPDPR